MNRPDSRTDSDPAESELNTLFGRLRDEPPSVAVRQTALGLPSRVTVRLREEGSGSLALAYRRWALGLAPLTLVCVVAAVLNLRELQTTALFDSSASGWLLLLLG